MTKNEALKRFVDYYSRLKDSDRNNFSRIANRLLSTTFIIRNDENDKADFLIARDQEEALRSYFAIIDYDFFVDLDKGVAYIKTNAEHNRVRLNKLDTITILVLRSIYFTLQDKFIETANVTTNLGNLISEISKTEIYPSFNTPSEELKHTLRKLRRHHIINFKGSLKDGEDEIVIYKSILLVVDSASVDDLTNRIELYKGVNEDEKN